MSLCTQKREKAVSPSERLYISYRQKGQKKVKPGVPRQAQHRLQQRSPESSCVNEKRRLLGFDGAWLFSLLDNHRNSHLESNPEFQQIHRNMSSLLSELVHSYY